MKINKAQDVNSVPDWVVSGSHIEAMEKNDKILQAGVERINITAASQVNDTCLFQECAQIEKCASSQETYYYNSTWSAPHLSHLKEYASVCGLPVGKMVGVDPSTVIEKKAGSNQMVKTASTEVQVDPLELALKEAFGDPFKIDERSDMSHMEKENWEQVTAQATISSHPPRTAMEGGILPLRGGEDTRISNQPSLPKNQNSIADPGALDRLWNSEEEDNGVRLAREAKERLDARANNHATWEQERIDAMKADNFVAQGKVFPTEVMNASSGITNRGAYSEEDLKGLPERTAGEQLASANQARKDSISRDKPAEGEGSSWDEIKAAPSRMVSDIFADELKKSLG